MIERPLPATPRVRAGTQPSPCSEPTRHWVHDRAPSLRSLLRDRQRRERVWAWLSLIVLIICWDASARLDQRVSPPRPKLTHAVDEEEMFRPTAAFSVDW